VGGGGPSAGAEPSGASGIQGFGDYDEATGLYEWYFNPDAGVGDGLTFGDLLTHWSRIEADLHERYGVDLDDEVFRRRTWRWLRLRILALLDVPPNVTPDGQALHATRLGWALFPPKQT
jgi:hypothetical protein